MFSLLIAAPLAAAMLVTLRWCRQGDTWGVVALLLLCVVWLRAAKAFEGPLVYKLAWNHGIVASDLFAVVVGVVGAGWWFVGRRRLVRARGHRAEPREQAAVGDRD